MSNWEYHHEGSFELPRLLKLKELTWDVSSVKNAQDLLAVLRRSPKIKALEICCTAVDNGSERYRILSYIVSQLAVLYPSICQFTMSDELMHRSDIPLSSRQVVILAISMYNLPTQEFFPLFRCMGARLERLDLSFRCEGQFQQLLTIDDTRNSFPNLRSLTLVCTAMLFIQQINAANEANTSRSMAAIFGKCPSLEKLQWNAVISLVVR